MKILVINLPSATERRARLQARADQLGLEIEFLIASGFDDLDEATLNRLASYWMRKIPGKDIGCFRSHFRAWEQVSKLDVPVLICEDDAVLGDTLAETLNHIEKHIKDDHVYDLETVPRRHLLAKKPLWTSNGDPEISARRIYQNKMGAGAYVLMPFIAQKLVRKTAGKYVMVDAYLWTRPWIKSYQIEPAPAFQDRCLDAYFGITQEEQKPSGQPNDKRVYGAGRWTFKSRMRRLGLELATVPLILIGLVRGQHRHIAINPETFDIDVER
ncbi:MAG: glycosyltransferase family 25 protein [Paracoccaceae bacterium]